MLALLYLLLMILLGDAICRRYFTFVSIPHRLAAAFLSGLLLSSWWTYLAAWLFAGTSYPMLWGNLIFFVSSIVAIYWLNTHPNEVAQSNIDPNMVGFEKWDRIFLGFFFVYAVLLTFNTFSMSDGKMLIATHQWSDFGSTVSIMQSFALGHNFPTEYPHYSGDRIRYHFLFYFAAGNLEYLGLNPALSNNILSISSTLSMLILVMTMGAVTFGSRVVGRVAAALFFFHGSLSFISYVYAKGSLSNVIDHLLKTQDFLPSGYNYRGELWGVWSQVVYANQRHLASSIGIFLLVLVFLIIRYREVPARIRKPKKIVVPPQNKATESDDSPDSDLSPDAEDGLEAVGNLPDGEAAETNDQLDHQELSTVETENSLEEDEPQTDEDEDKERKGDDEHGTDEDKPETSEAKAKFSPQAWLAEGLVGIKGFIFSGVLLGLMPMWNGAVFTAAFAVLALLFLMFPLRRQMAALGLTAAVVAIPQILYLKTGDIRAAGYSLYHWGYTLSDPTILSAAQYLGFIFGVKWLLIAIALAVGTFFHPRLFIAFTSLIAVAFFFQFSDEVLANHKFINVWLVLANLFVASGLWFLWNLRTFKTTIPARILAIFLTVFIAIGGIIDLFPFRNANWMQLGLTNDPLVTWLEQNTDPRSIFLSYRYVNHRILASGRRLFYGHPYYSWSAGYPTGERDGVYRKMLESTDPAEVFRLLKENRISYVAIDNMTRGGGDFIKKSNEVIYKAYFPTVYEDTENRADGLRIYAVTETLGVPDPNVQLPPPPATPEPKTGAFNGGEGNAPGQFSKPRGFTVDDKGNIFVADTGNNRIQKFDPDGKFVTSFGTTGSGEGEFREPNGIAVDAAGSIYVVDALNGTLIRFAPDGKFVKEWKGPAAPSFYGPRDISIGPNKHLYIVDQGRGRVVRFDPTSEAFSTWGSLGSGEMQLHEPTGIAIGGNLVFVMDAANNRIQAFDLDGKFVRQWPVEAWNKYPWHYPDAVFDDVSKRLYVTSGVTHEILAFDVDGNPQPGFKPDGEAKLSNPSSLFISETKGERRLLVLNTGGAKVSAIALEAKKNK